VKDISTLIEKYDTSLKKYEDLDKESQQIFEEYEQLADEDANQGNYYVAVKSLLT